MNYNKPLQLLSSLIFILMASGIGGTLYAQVGVGDMAPDLGVQKSYNTPDGGPITINSLRGKVVMIDFWATWCGPCVASVPKLEEWHQKYKDQGMVLLAHTDSSSRNLPGFIERHNISYIITVGNEIGGAYGIRGLPTLVVVDPQGKVAWRGHPNGFDTKLLEELLQQVQPDSAIAAPRFEKPSSHSQVAQIEQAISSGHVGQGLRALEQMINGRDNSAADAARATLTQINEWQADTEASIAELEEEGDVYAAWQQWEAMADFYDRHPQQREYRNKARDLRRHADWRAGEALEQIAAIPKEARSDPRFQRMVDGFQRRFPEGFYAKKLEEMLAED